MDNPIAQAEAAAKDALAAVIGDSPQDARRIIAALSFSERALLVAWAEELRRLGGQGQAEYETRERSAWRAAEKPLTHDERQRIDSALGDYLRTRVADGYDWTDLQYLTMMASTHTDAGTRAVREWAVASLDRLVQEGVLSKSLQTPSEYRIVRAPEPSPAG